MAGILGSRQWAFFQDPSEPLAPESSAGVPVRAAVVLRDAHGSRAARYNASAHLLADRRERARVWVRVGESGREQRKADRRPARPRRPPWECHQWRELHGLRFCQVCNALVSRDGDAARSIRKWAAAAAAGY